MASFLEQLEAIPATPQQPSGGGFLSKLDEITSEPQKQFNPEQQSLISLGQQYIGQQQAQGKPVAPNLTPEKLLSIGEGLQNLQTAQKGVQQAQENPTWQDVYAGQAAAGAVDFEQGLRILGAALDDDLLSDENLGTIAQQEEVKANFPQTEGMKKLAQSTGFLDTAKTLLGDIPGTLGPTFTRSLVQGAAPMAGGAAIGGVTGNVPGALIGTGVGAGVADAVQSFGDYLRQKNINLADPTAIRTALQDPEIKKEALKYAGIRGLIIGATSALGGGVAGKVASLPAKNLIGKGAAIAGDVALQSGIEGGGEAAAQLATTGKVNPADVAAEAIVGLPLNAAEITVGGIYQSRQQALTSKDIETPNKIKPIDLRPDGDPQVAATEAEILAKSEAMVKPAENLGTIIQPEEQNAQQHTQTTAVYGDVQQPEGTQEGQEEVPAAQSGEGISQAQEVTGDERFAPGAPQRVPVAPGASSTTEWRTRNFARRFTKDERINEETREQVPTEYLPITNQDTVDQVKEKIDQNGLVASAAQVMDFSNDLSPAQRVAMAELVLLRLNEASKLATKQNNVQDAAELNSLASDVAMEISSYGTRLGQGIQAFAIWNKLTPEGLIASTEKDIRNHGRPEGLTEEERAKLRPLAEATRDAPEGFLKNDAMRKYFLASSKLKGVKWTDMLTAYWYANILSGLNTQGINVFGSGINGAIQFLAQSTFTNPKDTMRFVQGMLKAATSIAAQEADATFISGSESQRLLKKFDAEPSALAQLYDPNAKGLKRIKNAFSYGEYVFRALQAADAFMYRSFAEGQAYLDSSRAARQKGGNYSANFLEQIGMTDEMRSDALKQAQSEVEEFGSYKNERQKKRDIARRAFEIMEASRNDEIRTSSDRFASLASYTNEPEGLVGQLARSMNQFVRSFSIQNKKTGERFTPLTFAVPFVNIVGNVLNGQLDMTPIGYVRAVRGKAFIDEKIDSPRERMRRVALATMGSGFAAVIAGSAEAFLDDDDPYFAVYAEGPKDVERKRNLMSQGWKPFTFKIGDKYIRYNETPMNLMMATIGGVHDARRFGAAYNRKSMAQQAAYVTTLGIRSFSEAGFLSSVMSLSDVLSGDADVGQFLTRIGTGLIPAQGLMRDIAKSLDPVIVDKRESLWPAIVGDIPVVKGFGTRPMLNAFGDPVTYSFYDRLPFAGRLFSERSIDPEWRYLAETGLRLPGLNRPIETSVAGLTKREKRTLAEVLKNRGEQLGIAAAEVFTDAEQYEFVEKSGPKIKEAVKELRTERSDMDKADQQDWLEKKVREIRTQTKKEILGID